MEPRKILAPHKEQDKYLYIRVPKWCLGTIFNGAPFSPLSIGEVFTDVEVMPRAEGCVYDDDFKGSRIISSRRVEQDVETGDFLRGCADEGLKVIFYANGGCDVLAPRPGSTSWEVNRGSGATLREAYFRYKAKAAHD